MALSVMVRHVDAVGPASHCNNEQTSVFEYSHAAVALRLAGGCVERGSRLFVKQNDYGSVQGDERCAADPEP